MSRAAETSPERVTVKAPREAVWSLLEDPEALRRILPGCESLRTIGPGQYEAVLVTRVRFVRIRADVTATFLDAERPSHIRLVLHGRPRNFGGEFEASIPLDFEGTGETTEVSYHVDVTASGAPAAFGLPVLRDALRSQVGGLVRNVERELASRG
ncbi:MAG TPA: SRPBCC domain-containing protein [Candidatus Limnocylindrales bacterium]